MTRHQAIHAYATVHDGTLVGSAFRASFEGRPFVLTGAHLPVGQHPTSDWSTYADQLSLVTPGGGVKLELLEAGSRREPFFGYIAGTDGQIGDILWWSLEGHRAYLDVLHAEYVMHEVPASFSVQPEVVAYGYPGSVNRWPEARIVQGTPTGLESKAPIYAET